MCTGVHIAILKLLIYALQKSADNRTDSKSVLAHQHSEYAFTVSISSAEKKNHNQTLAINGIKTRPNKLKCKNSMNINEKVL